MLSGMSKAIQHINVYSQLIYFEKRANISTYCS